ncbi:dCTP pyrophosphatase 1-like [Juglans microcarpa x Juglans regia]|uniref:dCTP pyrophosphatase 1-like n=1 Tax=Juglans microcarpa x Juglans regia TaxID=2249226 RepID=UPI001B7E148E|nr:dCTP pyrophosphatase 1-like [Juglans microcarpa x Juglans regia]
MHLGLFKPIYIYIYIYKNPSSPSPCRHSKKLNHGGEDVPEEKTTDISLKDLSVKLEEFAKARDWEKYHSPRNLLLAMVGEVGELSEIFQWRGEVDRGLPNWEESDKEHLGEELSDVLLYLIRLADICGIDLGDAATKKIVKNATKYPPKIL